MATWQDFIDLFPADFQPVIEELATTYNDDFSISDYETFAAQSSGTIEGQISSLASGHDLLQALATYYLGKAEGIPVDGDGDHGAFELMMFGMQIDDLPAMKALEDYLEGLPLTFEDFQAMGAGTLAATFGPADSETGFWGVFVYGLSTRIAVLADSEFGDFVLSLPWEERTSTETFLQLMVAADAGFDLEALAAMTTKTLAGKLKALNANPHLRYRQAQRAIVTVRDLVASHTADNEIEGLFLGSQGPSMRAGLEALQKSLADGDLAETVEEIGDLGLDNITSTIGGLKSNHLFFHGVATTLLTSFRDYQRMVADAAKLPITPITFQIRPSNDDARPLGGLLVEVTATVAGIDIGLGTRVLDFSGIAYTQYEGSTDSPITLTFEVMTPEEASLVTSSPLAFDPETETTIEVVVAVPALAVLSDAITALATEISLTIPSGLGAYLAAISLVTLEDLRQMGGLAKDPSSAVQTNLAVAQKLDHHAVLELLTDDGALREFLIDAGYTSPGKIAAKTRAAFVTELTGVDYGEVTLAGTHLKASKTDAVLTHLVLASGAGYASNYKGQQPLNPTLETIFSNQCDCEECRSGVSPLAYLAALLDYGCKYIQNDGVPVDIDWFQDTFHQGFCELPANCAAVEKKVCQVRIAIEAMRLYLGSVDIPYAYRKKYLERTYELLLNQCGVTVEEVRLAALATLGDPLLESVANRMGIDPSYVAAFYLDSTAGSPTLTEDDLELLFGFQSTLRNPYSDGQKLGDSGDVVTSWQFEGVKWGQNVDPDGFLYLKIVSSPPAVEVYRWSYRTTGDLVAYGAVSPSAPYTAELVPQNDRGLSGRIELSSVPNNSLISISAVPRLLAWRLQKQRATWFEQDWPIYNPYFVPTALPIVDPDIMGPDDIRDSGSVATDSPIAIWRNRRIFLDTIEDILRSCGSDVIALFDEMDSAFNGTRTYTDVVFMIPTDAAPWDTLNFVAPYDGLSWEVLFVTLKTDLAGSGTASAALAFITDSLHLSLEAFTRLDELFQIYLAAPLSPTYSVAEMEDLIAILMSSVRNTFRDAWVSEELWGLIYLTPDKFWAPIHEPKEGKWNNPIDSSPFYASPIATPFVDPVEVGLLELPDPIWGDASITHFQDRVLEIEAETAIIFAARTLSGPHKYLLMLEEALGALPTMPFADGSADIPALLVALNEPSPSYENALEVVNQVLFLTEAEFREAMKVISKEDLGGTPTTAEFEDLAKVLIHAWRRGLQWTIWQGQETMDTYWEAYKQKLNKWRGGKAQRVVWLEALALYSSQPIIDPDLIKAGDFINPEYNANWALDNKAYYLWRLRHAAIETPTTGWLALIAGDSLSDNIETILGSTTTEITELRDTYEQNKDVSARLAQLKLTPQGLTLIAKLVDLGTGWSNGDWDAFCAIMVQAKKERNFGAWKLDERDWMLVSLSPDFFQPPYQNYFEYHSYLDAILIPWRTSAAARRDWQDKLDARIDQEQSMIAGVAAMVKATEDRVLITLRDALIRYSGAPGANVDEKGEYLTEKLLMDFRIQCCNETTRVAQAIETLQVLFFSIRTGTIQDDYPDLEMHNNDDWDDDWKWLGSYATWRSLMFVYMYPENVLLPSLKDKKSGKFSELIDQVRNSSRFTPDMACEVLHDYEGYLRDMADLSLRATVTVRPDNAADGCGMLSAIPLLCDFHFAVGNHTRTAYWSIANRTAPLANAQSSWEVIPGMKGVDHIVGATAFLSKSLKYYVYVFGLRPVAGEYPELVANRFNLGSMQWESNLEDLKLETFAEAESWHSVMEPWTAMLAERSKVTDPIYFVGTSWERPSKWVDAAGVAHKMRTAFCPTDLKDRNITYNRLDDEGNGWVFETWKTAEILWMRSFKLAGVLFTSEKFLCIMGAVKYDEPQTPWYLAYHTFYEGNALSQADLSPIIALNGLWGPVVPTTSVYNLTELNQFKADATKIRHIPIGNATTPFNPNFDVRVGLVKHATGSRFELYFNAPGAVSTSVLTFNLWKVWFKPLLFGNAPSYSSDTSSTVAPSADDFRSVGIERVGISTLGGLASLPAVTFLGPCYDYRTATATAPMARAPFRFSLQHRDLYRMMLTQEGLSFYSLYVLRLNMIVGNLALPPINEHPTSNSSPLRRSRIESLYTLNQYNTRVNRAYLEEAYYLLPIFVALELQKNKQYEAALEVFRLLYDYTLPITQRKLWAGLVAEESIVTSYSNVMAWLDDPENPHTIAGMRANTYTRFTIFSIVRCMLEMADQEFTIDSPESVPRARTLYLAARELIQDEIYGIETDGCGALLEELDVEVNDAGWLPEWLRLKAAIAVINNHDAIDLIVNGTGSGSYPTGIVGIFANMGLTWEQKIMAAESLYQVQLNALGSAPNRLCNVVSDWSIQENNIDIILGNDNSGMGIGRMSAEVGAGFLSDLSLVTAKTVEELTTDDDLPWLAESVAWGVAEDLDLSLNQRLGGEAGYYEAYYEANPLLGLRASGNNKRPFIPYSNHYFCVPKNPVPFNLLLHAELNLFKIRHCRNIAGIHRELDPYGAPTDTTSGMPVIGANGQIAFPGSVAVPPTPYRYEVVLARAKELVQLSAQAESAMLVTLEKLDSERYSLLRARQDLSTAKATVRLQDLRVNESEHEVDYAEMQQQRAQEQLNTYEGWLSEGMPNYERLIIEGYRNLANIRRGSAWLNFGQQELQYAREFLSFGLEGNILEKLATGGIILYGGLLLGSGVLAAMQLNNQVNSINQESDISINQVYASWEQRNREYTFQRAMSEWDVKLAGQQIKLANDRLRITGQERALAQMQADHAEETLEFLRTKFTNAELYDWMSGVLQRVYSFYLQHATSMAKIAQQQLAFERQEAPANLILDDYWSPPSDNANVPGVDTGTSVERRGLTGSARLQMDLTKLDLYSFETEKRKLQLTKTMSMAQLFPAEFEVFRQTGVLRFRTRMEWFDRDFPGHYLRLIKRVRTSVIALVPPGEGIRARLATTGVSRVVVGGDAFQTVVTHRGSESVSLTSPIEATGLFEMLPDRGDMLYPFEGMGVDAEWEFRMYKAANPLNFNTIADVMITFEYTALENFDYENQIISSFDMELHGERAFSFKYLFPDQWYDLQNALSTNTPYIVDFDLRKGDFPGLAHLEVEHVTLMLITKTRGVAEHCQLELWKDAGGGNFALGGFASANADGVMSSRSGTTAWTYFGGQVPEGKWRLNCSDRKIMPPPAATLSPSVKGLINPPIPAVSELEDILLIVGYVGDSPGYGL